MRSGDEGPGIPDKMPHPKSRSAIILKKHITLVSLISIIAVATGCQKSASTSGSSNDDDVTRQADRQDTAARRTAKVQPLESTQEGPRVLLIGLDAAEWEVIDPMIAAVRLPNLKSLVENGVRAPLKSNEPTISPAIWTKHIGCP